MFRFNRISQALNPSPGKSPPAAASGKRPTRQKLNLEALEPRLLLSATLPGSADLLSASLSAASVITDKQDYVPGETALITSFNAGSGSGFEAGEWVRFAVTRTDGIPDYAMGNVPWFVLDGAGGFSAYQDTQDRDADGINDWIRPDTDNVVNASIGTSWYVEEQYADSTLRLSAAGQTSGAVAAHDFTDSVTSLSIDSPANGAAVSVGDGSNFTVQYDAVTTATYPGMPVGTTLVSQVTTARLDPGGGGAAIQLQGTDNLGSTAGTFNNRTFAYTVPAGTATGTYKLEITLTQTFSNGQSRDRGASQNNSVTVTVGNRLTSLAVGAQTGSLTYGTSGEAQYAVDLTGAAGTYAANLSLSGLAGFTLDTDGNEAAGEYWFENAGGAHLTSLAFNGLSSNTQSATLVVKSRTSDNAGTAGSFTVTAVRSGAPTDTETSASNTLVIGKAAASFSIISYTGVYDGAAHGINAALSTATGATGANLSGLLSFSGSFTDAPGGTADWNFAGDSNHLASAGTAAIVITKAIANVSVSGYTGTYDGAAHGATGTATGVGGANLSSGLDLGASFTDAPGGTASWSFEGGTNYEDQVGTAAIVIGKATATVLVNGYTGTYDAAAHGATGTATGVGGANLSSGLDLGASFTDAPGGTANWSFSGGTNYTDQSGSVSIVISKANAVIHVTPYDVTFDTQPHTATGTATGVGGVNLGAGLNLSGTTHTNAGTYSDTWTFNGGTNYVSTSGTITDRIATRDASVRYIGQTNFVTSGSSSTTAQVTLTASVQDPSGVGLIGATVDFIDALTGKVLASGVKVAAVAGSPGNGTANTVVTLSTGQYGSQTYQVFVKMTGNYDNADQNLADKTAAVVVSKPASANTIVGGGVIQDTATTSVAGSFAGSGTTTYSVSLQYNKQLTNLQGQIQLSIDQGDGSIIVIKSNSLSSMSVSAVTGGKQSTVYTKASIVRINADLTTTTIEGNVTLRMDVTDLAGTSGDRIGFTVLSTKDSTLYYSNDWFYDATTMTWKSRSQSLFSGQIAIG